MKNLITYSWLLGLWCTDSTFAACPVYLEKHDLQRAGIRVNPVATSLYKYTRAQGWQAQAIQAVALDDEGLVHMESNDMPLEWDIGNFRLMFNQDAYGEKAPESQPPPCDFRRRFALRRQAGSDAYAYLFWCKKPPVVSTGGPFKLDTATRTVDGPFYKYVYNEHNNVLFDDIWIKGEGEPAPIHVARRAELAIRADVKRFFAFNFGVRDVESKIKYLHTGSVSFVSVLDFFLKMLFFRINLELNTSLSFFDRSVNVPMILHMPVHAQRWVHPGTGIFYSWESKDDFVRYDLSASRMPAFNADLIKKGFETLGKTGLSYCSGESCVFDLVIRLQQKPVSMQFRIARYLVERGFYPQFVSDLPASQKALNWPQSVAPSEGWRQSAIYFDNSGTAKGEHIWDFWLHIHDDERSLSEVCPERNFQIVKP